MNPNPNIRRGRGWCGAGKLVGHPARDLDAEVVDYEEMIGSGWEQVKFQTARMVLRIVPGARVKAAVNATDRGGPGRLAKRWYMWFVRPEWVVEARRGRRG